MTQYTVTWWEAADDELLRLWLDSSERSRVTDASREIDRLLSTAQRLAELRVAM